MDPGLALERLRRRRRAGRDGASSSTSGAPLEPLLRGVEREGLSRPHVLRTHAHADHVEHEDELRRLCPVVTGPRSRRGGLEIEALPTPGHSDDMVAFVVNGEAVFTGRHAVQGRGRRRRLRADPRSVMDVLMRMPHERRVLPGHTDETTIGREWEQNPFVRVWRGVEPEGTERVPSAARDATLSSGRPTTTARARRWVRFDDGRDAIVGGSRVERSLSAPAAGPLEPRTCPKTTIGLRRCA